MIEIDSAYRYLHDLESVATDLIKNILNAATQRGAAVPAACLDQHTAIQAIARQKQLAQIELERATTLAEAEAARDAGIAAMQAVNVLNVAVFAIDGFEVESPASVTGNRVTVAIRQPDVDPPVPGNVAASATGALLSWKTVTGGYDLDIRLPPDAGEAAVQVDARNLCGPARLELTLKAAGS